MFVQTLTRSFIPPISFVSDTMTTLIVPHIFIFFPEVTLVSLSSRVLEESSGVCVLGILLVVDTVFTAVVSHVLKIG